jgi:hypothetical protein
VVGFFKRLTFTRTVMPDEGEGEEEEEEDDEEEEEEEGWGF